MKMVRRMVLLVSLAAPALVFAQSVVDQRQANQERRIDQGVRSGALTEREAARLDRGQAHIDRMEDRAQADGRVTARERRRLDQAQDVQSQRIYREKHDRQHDFNHDGRQDRPARRIQR